MRRALNALLVMPFLSFKVLRTHDVAWAKALLVSSSLLLVGRVAWLAAQRKNRQWVREQTEQQVREDLWSPDLERRLALRALRVLLVLGFISWCLFL